MNLEGQVALVTGGARGIGRAIVKSLVHARASVVIVDKQKETAEMLSKELNKNGATTICIEADVTKMNEVKHAVSTTKTRFGKLDILVNNAGWDKICRFIHSNEQDWLDELNINLLGQMRFCHETLPIMIEQKYGRIINISSDAGRVGTSGQVAYSAAKGGVIAFSKGLAREIIRYGITVNSVAPGPTHTPLYQEVIDQNPKLSNALEKAIPMRRAAEPEEISHVVLMLAAQEASYITGQTISVSGGLTMI